MCIYMPPIQIRLYEFYGYWLNKSSFRGATLLDFSFYCNLITVNNGDYCMKSMFNNGKHFSDSVIKMLV